MENKIPKVIHYCWFGGNPLPELAKKCIASWEKFCPDYEIKEWNESNFDIHCCAYVKEAYEEKKWAFVSDYARFWILYHEGGLYFDTDVEIIAPLDELVSRGSFMGCEFLVEQNNSVKNMVNPGLGLAAAPGLGLYKEIIDFYNHHHFYYEDGSLNKTTVVEYTTEILKKHGLVLKNEIMQVEGMYIYPPEYFCPKNYVTGEIHITSNTKTIHHYSASWHSKEEQFLHKIAERCIKICGLKWGNRIFRIINFPYRFVNKAKSLGLKKTLIFIVKKKR